MTDDDDDWLNQEFGESTGAAPPAPAPAERSAQSAAREPDHKRARIDQAPAKSQRTPSKSPAVPAAPQQHQEVVVLSDDDDDGSIEEERNRKAQLAQKHEEHRHSFEVTHAKEHQASPTAPAQAASTASTAAAAVGADRTGRKRRQASIATDAVYSCEFCGADLTGQPLAKRLQHLGKHKGSELAARRLAESKAGTLPAYFGFQEDGQDDGDKNKKQQAKHSRQSYTHKQQIADLQPLSRNEEQLMIAQAMSVSLAESEKEKKKEEEEERALLDVAGFPIIEEPTLELSNMPSSSDLLPPLQQQKQNSDQQQQQHQNSSSGSSKTLAAKPHVIATKAAPVFMRSNLASGAVKVRTADSVYSLWHAASSAGSPPLPPPRQQEKEQEKEKEQQRAASFRDMSKEDRRCFVKELLQDPDSVSIIVDALSTNEQLKQRLCDALAPALARLLAPQAPPFQAPPQPQAQAQRVRAPARPIPHESDPCLGMATELTYRSTSTYTSAARGAAAAGSQLAHASTSSLCSPPVPMRLTARELVNVRLSPVRIRSSRPVEQWSDAELRIAVKEYGRKPGSRDDMLAFLQAVRVEQSREACTPIGAGRIDLDARQQELEEQLSACIKGDRALYERILLLKVVRPEEVRRMAQERGLRCSVAQVRAFLEKQGVAMA